AAYRRTTSTDEAGFAKEVRSSIAKIQRAGLLDEQGDDFEVSPVLRLMIGPDTAREFIALYREAGVDGLEDPSDAEDEGQAAVEEAAGTAAQGTGRPCWREVSRACGPGGGELEEPALNVYRCVISRDTTSRDSPHPAERAEIAGELPVNEKTAYNPLVSLVIPVYNSMPYLIATLDAIEAQALDEDQLEVIRGNSVFTGGSAEGPAQ